MGLGTCLFCASCKGDASFVQPVVELSPKRVTEVCAPYSARERRLQPVFCTALRAEVGTLYSPPFAVLGVTGDGFQRCQFSTEDCYVRGGSELALSWSFVFPVASFRSRRFGTSVRYGGSTCWFGMLVRHVVSTKQGRQPRIVETVLRQFRFGSEPRGHAPGGMW